MGALTTAGNGSDLLSKAMTLYFRRITTLLFLGLSLIGTMRAQGQPNEGNRPPGAGFGRPTPTSASLPDHILVQHRVGANVGDDQRSLESRGARLLSHHAGSRISVLSVDPSGRDQMIQDLQASGQFSFVEPDYVAVPLVVPNDPSYSQEWHLLTIQAPSAWDVTTGSSSVPIAMIDSGVDPTHPDLASKLIPGWSFLTGTTDTHDVLGHGTQTAGTAAAIGNNAVGVAGIAWQNPIMPLVVLNSSDWATYSDIANAIMYAADHKVRIVNISIGGSSSSSTLQSAVDYAWSKGTVVFAAAGNYSNSSPIYPAACTNVVAVGATDSNDTLASFSSYGSYVDLTAPGVNIMTTLNGGGYAGVSGTSFSSPIAAGVAALVLSLNPSLSAQQLVTLLEQNSDDLGAAGYDQFFGWGRVNASRAVVAAGGGSTTPPTVTISSPAPSSILRATVTVQGNATAPTSLSSIELWVDGAMTSTTTVAAFSFNWDTTTVGNGPHTLTVIAREPSGVSGQASVNVSVSNSTLDTAPPSVSISSPANVSTVAGLVPVQGSATDNVGVVNVQLLVDGTPSGTTSSSAFSFNWNSSLAANGNHTITVNAADAAGNVGHASTTVYVSNQTDTIAPTVSITSPVDGGTFAGNMTVRVVASDNVGVTQVSLYIDGALQATDSSAPYTFTFNATKMSRGTHTLTAKAWDAAGNFTTSAAVTGTTKR
jgi:thermitase